MIKVVLTCAAILVWVEHAAAVYPCYKEQCPPGYYFNLRRCECVKICIPPTCYPPKTLNLGTCKCTCPYCAPPKVLNTNTCECKCPPVYCPYPKKVNPNTCLCQCPYKYCPYNQVQDPYTCQCKCPYVYCPYGIVSPHTCKCIYYK